MSFFRLHKRDAILWIGIAFVGAFLFLSQIHATVSRAMAPVHPPVTLDFAFDRLDGVSLEPPGSASSPARQLSVRMISNLLVDAIVQVESAGDPTRVGSSGERGLMQIKRTTWDQMTNRAFGRSLEFELAFNPEVNRRVGKIYLAELQRIIHDYATDPDFDERDLLLAAYNAGPTVLMESSFDIRRLNAHTQDYVARVTALHDLYLEQHRALLHRVSSVRPSSTGS